MDELRLTAQHRLATYGTLAPGCPNHHQVVDLAGRWVRGYVTGNLVDAGWGAELGFPALSLDPAGDEVVVDVLESRELPTHWVRLDEFEGSAYSRVTAAVTTPEGTIDASIYVHAPA